MKNILKYFVTLALALILIPQLAVGVKAEDTVNNTIENAIAVESGTTYTGSFSYGNVIAYYKFEMKNGGELNFKFNSDTIKNLSLSVWDCNGNYMTNIEQNTGFFSLAKGTYYIVVFPDNEYGSFTIQMTANYAVNSKNYNSMANALPVTMKTTYYGNIGLYAPNTYEESYYKVVMPYGGKCSYQITSSTVKYGIIYIYDSNGQEVVNDYLVSGYVYLAKGTYYIKVSRNYSEGYYSEGNYSIKFTASYAKDSANYNSFSKAKSIEMGNTINGTIGLITGGYEESYYKIKMACNGTLKLTDLSDDCSYSVNIYDSNKVLKHKYATISTGKSLTLNKGTYYIKVYYYWYSGIFKLKTSARYDNPITVKASKTSVKYSKTKKRTIKLKVTGAKGKVTYKSSSKSRATVSSKGVVTIKKGAKKGTVTITVKAAGTSSSKAVSYKAGTKKVKIKIK